MFRSIRKIYVSYSTKRKTKLIIRTAATTLTASTILITTSGKSPQLDYIQNLYAGIRFLRSVKIGLLITMDYYISGFGLTEGDPNYDNMMEFVHRRSAERILEGCLSNGGTYIKIGQTLVSLSHILPKEYIETLSQLQDKAFPRSILEVEQLFKEDFGKSPYEMYKSFNDEPIAAASLAQVFRAVTLDNKEVAVKVQYNDLQERFVSDVSTITFLLKIAKFFHPSYDFEWIMTDVVDNLKEELDFYKEGKNAERCAKDLKHLKFLYIPKVYWDLCSRRVLVTDYVSGVKVSDIAALKQNGHNLADIDTKLFKIFGEQIFQTGFVHADPHPGNVHIRKHNNRTQIILLDHGLYQFVGENDRVALSHFWKALVMGNHKKMKEEAERLGVDDYTMLAEILTQRPLKSTKFRLVSKLSEEELKYMAEFAQKRFDLIIKTLRTMPRSLLFVTRNLNTIRAIAHDHGDPIDRYTILARAATKTAFTKSNFFGTVLSIPHRIYFEIQIIRSRVWVGFVKAYFYILHKLGRSPDTSEIFSKIG